MRLFVETKDGDNVEGVLALKDESFVMLKLKRDIVRVFHWDCIRDVKRVNRGVYQSVNLDIFKKTRE